MEKIDVKSILTETNTKAGDKQEIICETGSDTADSACSDEADEVTPISNSTTIAVSLFSHELSQIKTFIKPTTKEIEEKKVILGLKEKKYTLVLDLDHTLVFSVPLYEADEVNYGAKFAVKIRPYALSLLERLSEKFEIVIFTAAEQEYAKAITELLDPHHKFVRTVVTQQSCFIVKSRYFVKDLRIFSDRNLSEMLIVDDNVFSFAFQLENGVPVSQFKGNKDDDELLYLIGYLESVYNEPELLKYNRSKIGLL